MSIKAGILILGAIMLAPGVEPFGVRAATAMQGDGDDPAREDAAAVKACLDYVAAQDEAADAAATEAGDAADTASAGVTQATEDRGPEAYLRGKARSKARPYAHDCIGVVADACLALEENQSTEGMMGCFGREADVWDQMLNRAYKKSLTPQSYDNEPVRFKIESDQIRNKNRAL